MKKYFYLLCMFILCLSFSGCGDNGNSDTKNTEEMQSSEETVKETNLCLVTCANEKTAILYDLATYDSENLDNSEVWRFTATAPELVGKSEEMSSAKYREDTVFGDVVIVSCGNGYAAIVSYPEKEILWQVFNAGKNAHSIEILPSGNIVVVSSTGGTIRLFAASAMLQNDAEKASTYKEYPIKEGHGVLWDPEYDVLWTLGWNDLKAYSVVGEGLDEELELREDMGATKYGLEGHDLSADFLDSKYLWVTGMKHMYHVNKETGEMSTDFEYSDMLEYPTIRGFGNDPYGNYYVTMPSHGVGTTWENESYASWSTDKINFYYPSEDSSTLENIKCKSLTKVFYKVFSFYGKYQ